jgi:ferredoxin-NADP reductase
MATRGFFGRQRTPSAMVERLPPGQFGDETTLTYTRRMPEGWTGSTGRIDVELVAGLAWPDGRAYVCGPNGFVETAAGLLMECGYEPARIRTERFGPS